MRLYKGGDIKQVSPTLSKLSTTPERLKWGVKVSQKLKDEVPDAVKEEAREMARQELARRLEELDMKAVDARTYGALLTAVEAHIAQLHDLLESKLQS